MAETNTTPSVAVPPKTFKRNEYGLIADGSVNYVFNEDGTINWRKMVKPEFLQPNKRVFQRRGKPVPDKIDGLSDMELIILLGGLKELAQVRGYKSIEHTVSAPSGDYVASVCKISWIPNYETEGREVSSSSIGDAHAGNTDGFGRNYLAAFAENRAFVRCIRTFLKINIVSDAEIGGDANAEKVEDVSDNLLVKAMNQYGVTFEAVKNRLLKDGVAEAEKYTSVSDIPRFRQFELIDQIKKKAAEKGLA